MGLISLTSKIFLFTFLFFSMLGIGMQTDITALFSNFRKKMASLLFANFVIVPLLGVIVIRELDLAPEMSAAFLLLSCTPGGVSALQFNVNIDSDLSFAGSSACLMALLAIVISPLIMVYFLPPEYPLIIPYGLTFLLISLFLFLPMVLGMIVRRKYVSTAKKLAKPFAIAGFVAAFIAGWLIWEQQKQAITAIGFKGIFGMLAFTIICMGIGWLMGGPNKQTRLAFAISTGTRNAALCLIIAIYSFSDPAVQTPLVAFSGVSVISGMVLYYYSVISSLRRKIFND